MSTPKKRPAHNGALRFLVFIIVLLLLAVLSTTVFFNIETVKVTGSSNYAPEDILEASGIKAGDNIFRTSMQKVSKRIEDRLVYVGHANIKRTNTSTVTIEIEPAVPAANFVTPREVMLVSNEGKILDSFEEPRASLYTFYGTEPKPGLLPGEMYSSGDPKKDESVYSLLRFFSEVTAGEDTDADREQREQEKIIRGFAENITSIDVSDRSDIVMVYDDRINVEMGNINDIERKIMMCCEIIERYPEDQEGTIVSLSDGGYSFRDKASIERSNIIFESNISKYNETTTTEETEEGGSEKTGEEGSEDGSDGGEEETDETRAPEMHE